MERGGNIHRTDSSFRLASSSVRSGDGMEGFSAYLREGDDEHASKWAALQRLPTFDRLRKGLLRTSNGMVEELDVCNLGLQERRELLERLIKDPEEDNEKLLMRIKSRIDRVGIQLPTIEVRFEHLNVEAQAYAGSRASPTFLNFSSHMVEGFLNYLLILPSKKKCLSILKDVSGIIKPSRLTLLLGPPSSGKTTLLLALAGKLDPSVKVSGQVTYNGHTMEEFVPESTAAYISQQDLHLAQLTVRETLAFSARCQGVGFRHHMLVELLRREKAANINPDPDLDLFMKAVAAEGQEANVVTDYILKIIGLEKCADTIVGNEMIRGISGGQRKRLTTGEMLVGPARALFMDEISTGLDSSTTFGIVKSLRHSVHILNGTAVISLLQPAPETYELFDDVLLLSDGQIVYQGPREHVLEFFEYMGFRCPERKAIADFLQEVTSLKDQEQYWARRDQPYFFVSAKDFSEAFKSLNLGQRIRAELAIPFDKTKSHPAALATNKYGVGKMELFKACFSREFLLLKRNSFVYIFKFLQLMLMATLATTIFPRTLMHRNSVTDGGIYVGAMFYTLMSVLFNAMVELTLTIAKLPVFYKQRDFLFFPPWAFALPQCISRIPMALIEVALWVFITYYAIGFDPDPGRFFRQYLLLLLINQMASALFRFMAAVGRSIIVANTFGAFAMLMFIALGGFVISQDEIKKWWVWGYWISPMMYGQNALVVNEFLGKSWSHIASNSTETLGVQVLKSRGFFLNAYWFWVGAGALIGFMLLFNFCFTMALTFLNPFGSPHALISQKSESTELRDKTGAATKVHSDSGEKIRINSPSMSSKRTGVNEVANHSKNKGMILPFEPHTIAFDDITYSIDMPQELKNRGVIGCGDRLVLLKEVSGAFRPGVLTTLMGVSGAGKTTLMDVLFGRKTSGYISGNISVSGYPKNQQTFARISGYCEQNDIHSPHVTVYESLLYSAWLRLSPEIDSETRKMFIEEVIELMELNPLRQALVGLPGVSGLSMEQRKRLTVAVELVANPSIIFMDEPTSGLDARAAAIVMRTVRNTVDTGRTVVCTIHQPSIDMFESFDELILLKHGGETLYAGPLGHHSSLLINYFQRIEGVNKIKEGYNPATWMLEVTSSAQEMALGVDFAAIYRSSELYKRNKEIIKELSTPIPGSKDLHFPTRYSQSLVMQFVACLWKQHWSYWRNPKYTAVRFLFSTFIALLFGTIFWDLGSKTRREQGLFNAMGSMYTAVLFIGFQNVSSVQPVVAVERSVFYREKAAGMYSALPYAFAQVTIELPYIFVQASVYSVIVYAMIGFDWTAAKFFWYLFFLYFTLLCYTFYGMMVVAVTPNLHVASIISSLFLSLWNLFSGFIIPPPRIPVWWKWYTWACPVAWTLYGLVGSQYGDIGSSLETGQTVEDFISTYFGYRHDFLGVAAAVIVGFAVLFSFIFAVSIMLFNYQRR